MLIKKTKIYKGGQVKKVGFLQQNKEVGEWKTYYENGVLSSIGKYEEGEKQGEWLYYWPNSKLHMRCNYVNGEKYEILEKHDEEGK